MKLTIKQIAEMANVSKGTVSKVLNGYSGISAKTSERILKLVQQLDFHPDSSARALALQKTGILGFLIPHEPENSLSGYFWATVMSAISKHAGLSGYSLLVLTTPREGDIKSALMPILKRNNVDGLIIGSELLDKESLATLMSHKVPFVLLGQNPVFQHYCVDVDSAQGTSLLVGHMLERGYQKIGALFGPTAYPYVRERFNSYHQTLAKAGINWTTSTFSDYLNHLSTEDKLNAMFERHPDMDGLYISSGGDFLFDALMVLRKRGINIPDFGIGVFDDYPFLEFTHPPVTSIRQPLAQAGMACVDMLLQLIHGEEPSPDVLRLPTTLICRGSLRDQPAS